MSPPAARAYRELLRVQRALFAGDLQARIAARIETRDQFLAHANAKPEEVPELILDAYNTAGFLHENVAQTVRKNDGNYCARPSFAPMAPWLVRVAATNPCRPSSTSAHVRRRGRRLARRKRRGGGADDGAASGVHPIVVARAQC